MHTAVTYRYFLKTEFLLLFLALSVLAVYLAYLHSKPKLHKKFRPAIMNTISCFIFLEVVFFFVTWGAINSIGKVSGGLKDLKKNPGDAPANSSSTVEEYEKEIEAK